MDLSFFRRAERRFASRDPARLDYDLLVALLRARREALLDGAPTPRKPIASGPRDGIAEILLAGADWREAVWAQGGSFSPGLVRHGSVNGD